MSECVRTTLQRKAPLDGDVCGEVAKGRIGKENLVLG